MSRKLLPGGPVELQPRAVSPLPESISPKAARQSLERVLASRCFAGSKRLILFLKYIGELALAGQEEPKEFDLGLRVFERDASIFDPRIDSIVRVHANRLRHKLREYYETEGAADPCRIELPKGRYLPVFHEPAPHITPVAPGGGRHTLLLISAGAAVLLLLVAWRFWPVAAAGQSYHIAVMPFQYQGDPGEEYLADGLTEEISDQLARFPRLSVAARGSTFTFKGKSWDLKTAGGKLSVGTIVDGSMHPEGPDMRIAAELVDTATGKRLWSDSYLAARTELPEIRNSISRAILATLKIASAPPRTRPVSMEARNLYLQGNFFWNKRTHEALLKGIDLFQQAIARDPDYALAYSGLAASYAVMAANVLMDPREAGPKGKAAAQKALSLDDTLADAHAALGLLLSICDWDWHGADEEFQRALVFNPSHASAHQWRAHNLLWLGRFTEANAEIRKALEVDPLSLVIQSNQAEFAYFERDYNRAIQLYRRTLESDPQFISAHIEMGMTYTAMRQWDQAIEWYEKAARLTNLESSVTVGEAEAYAARGDTSRGRELLSELRSSNRPYYVSHWQLAVVLGALGERDQAFAELEEAYRRHESGMAQLRVAPGMDSLRTDPRFRDFLSRMRL